MKRENTKHTARRWLILANGHVVGTEYRSEGKAWRQAWEYAEHVANQDIPSFPHMSVIAEEIE